MGFQFALTLHPIEMSQQFLNFSLRLLVLASVFLSDSGSSAVNITRYTSGDVFQNTNSSKSCKDSGADCVLVRERSPFCGVNCCNCVCPSETPTYLLRDRNCSSEDHLMSILKAQSTEQGCQHRMVVAKSHIQCTKKVLTTLNTVSPGNKTLYLCPWNRKISQSQAHFNLVRNFIKCEIIPEESRYLLNGSWKVHPRHDPALSKWIVEIGQHPLFYSNILVLKWIADIGKQYDGLIFSIKLKCHSAQGNVSNFCVHFKKAGSFTDIKPTKKPALLKSTRTSSTSVQQTTVKTAETAPATTTTVTSTEKSTQSTAHVSTSFVVGDVGVTSFVDQPQHDITVIILAALAGALFVLLACTAVFFLLWRRKRRFDVKKEAKNASNPIYDRGASDTLKMAKIQNGNGAAEEEWPEYQPLVENTKPRERKDSLPGYQVMSIAQKPNQQPTSNRDIRSSNYLSLVKDDLEEGQQYQTLVKDQNPQRLEMVDENKIPDYAELEERSDSEDSFDSEDSKDYEEPPVLETIIRAKPAPQIRLNDLSSAFHDYDEPEGIIVISDNENDPHEQAVRDGNDFHDYADPDDTDEDNINCHVTASEDLTCYHDYDDPPSA